MKYPGYQLSRTLSFDGTISYEFRIILSTKEVTHAKDEGNKYHEANRFLIVFLLISPLRVSAAGGLSS
jgi:hypothetical protein